MIFLEYIIWSYSYLERYIIPLHTSLALLRQVKILYNGEPSSSYVWLHSSFNLHKFNFHQSWWDQFTNVTIWMKAGLKFPTCIFILHSICFPKFDFEYLKDWSFVHPHQFWHLILLEDLAGDTLYFSTWYYLIVLYKFMLWCIRCWNIMGMYKLLDVLKMED